MSNNIVLNVRTNAKAALAEIDKLKAKLVSLKTTKGWQDALTGVAIGAGLGVYKLATDAIRGVGDQLGDAVGKAAEFERAMLNVQSIAQETPAGFKSMSDSVRQLARELPTSAADLARGLYDISSSGFAGAEGVKVLQAAAKAASAGLATTAESARAVTAVLNAYGLSADQAGTVSDKLFQIVNRGVVTFPELAANIGKTTALAAPLGVSLDDVGAGLAVLTKAGIDADNATTQLNAILQSILQPSAEAESLASDLGLAWNASALQAKGLNGVLADMIQRTGGNKEQMAALLGESRAIRGAFVLAADGGQNFTEELGYMQKAAGATEEVLSVQKQGLAYQLDIFNNQVNDAKIAIGEELAPVLKDFMKLVREDVLPGLKELAGWFSENKDWVFALIEAMVPFARTSRELREWVKSTSASYAEQKDKADAAAQATRAYATSLATASKAAKVADLFPTYPLGDRPMVLEAKWEFKPPTKSSMALGLGLVVSEARRQAKAATDAFASGVLTGKDTVQGAWDELVAAIENTKTKGQRLAWLQGKLNSAALARGLKSGDPYVKKAAEDARAIWIAEMDALTKGAYSAGLSAVKTLGMILSGARIVRGALVEQFSSDEMKQLRSAEAEFKKLKAEIERAGPPRVNYGNLGTGAASAAEETKGLIATVKDARAGLGGLRDRLADLRATFASGWTPTVLTADQAGKALTASLGGAKAALDRLRVGSAPTMSAVAKAFGTMKTAAASYYDALHRQALQSISDARAEMNARYDAQVAQIEGGVQAMRDRLARQQAAREEDRLRSDVATASSEEDRIAAQQRLDDFLAQAAIDRADERARAQIAELEASRRTEAAGLDKRESDENAKYELVKGTLEKIFTETDSALEAVKNVWDTKNKAVLALLRTFVGDYRDAGAAIMAAFNEGLDSVKAGTPTAGEPTPATTPPGRASGGPVMAGRTYVVGERGPETFVPTVGGTILPAGAGGASVTIGSINVTEATDPKATAREVLLAVKRELNRQGVSLTPATTF